MRTIADQRVELEAEDFEFQGQEFEVSGYVCLDIRGDDWQSDVRISHMAVVANETPVTKDGLQIGLQADRIDIDRDGEWFTERRSEIEEIVALIAYEKARR